MLFSNEKENILDSDEIEKPHSIKSVIPRIIGISFLVSIPIVFILIIQYDDPGFFLPKTDFIESIIPDRLNYIEYNYEIRCLEGVIGEWVILYFAFLGFLNLFFWKKNTLLNLRIAHAVITILLSFIFFQTMIEEDIFHALKIESFQGKIEYENKVSIFYKIFIFWILIQIIYFLAYIRDQVRSLLLK